MLVFDSDNATAEKGVANIVESLRRKVDRGAISRGDADLILGRITVGKRFEEIASVDLVIEAVFEEVEIKRSLIGKIGEVCPPSTVIASNTSTIDLDLLVERLHHPGSLVGMHFFNPAHHMPLVEVVRRAGSDPEAVASVLQLAKEMKKTAILVNNSVGFVVNRLFIPYCIEAYRLIEEGARPSDIDSAMTSFGFPMGPLTLIDMTGIDILAITNLRMCAAYPWHLPFPAIGETLLREGCLGQKSGCGIYRYDTGKGSPAENVRVSEIAGAVRNVSGIAARTIGRGEITERLVMRLAAEALRLAHEKNAPGEQEIDVAMVLGAGFPDYRGGPLRYVRDIGPLEALARLERLADSFGERYRPGQYIQSILEE